jgi:hypothetical protein
MPSSVAPPDGAATFHPPGIAKLYPTWPIVSVLNPTRREWDKLAKQERVG